MSHIHRLATGFRCGPQSTKSIHTISATLTRSFSSAVDAINPPRTKPSSQNNILAEHTLLSQISPLKRILCLCPVPLGRSRVSWSGGDLNLSSYPEDNETINLDFQSQPHATTRNIAQMQPLKVMAKYRYGERFSIGVAVSDPYLTHATPVHLSGEEEDGDDDADPLASRRLVAEIVPTFRCDAHNLGTSPIFHTNLPYFRNDFLRHIGHFDIGAIVLAMPMKPADIQYCSTPTKVQLEQEQKLDQVRECLSGILQNYVSVEEDEVNGTSADNSSGNDDSRYQHPTPLGPLNVQGSIDHRLSITDVLSNPNQHGHWDHISKSLQQYGGSTRNTNLENKTVHSSVPPGIHAAVALNAMMENYGEAYGRFS